MNNQDFISYLRIVTERIEGRIQSLQETKEAPYLSDETFRLLEAERKGHDNDLGPLYNQIPELRPEHSQY